MLNRVAYRMLGSVSDAEDVVQDAWLRWSASDTGAVRSPDGFLRRTVVRLCLDRIKSARARREVYPGPWLPEPIVEDEPVDDVTLPLMLALERLSPLERASFLLHDVFGDSFEAIGETLGRNAASCRQLAARAREHVRSSRQRYAVSDATGMAIAKAFCVASRSGDISALRRLLASDIEMQSDGGGKRSSVTRVLIGADIVVRAIAAIARLTRRGPWTLEGFAYVNGLPGFVTREADGLLQTTALLIDNERIVAIYIMRNPDKLRHLVNATA